MDNIRNQLAGQQSITNLNGTSNYNVNQSNNTCITYRNHKVKAEESVLH